MQNEIVELYLDDIIPNRFQPREKFDSEALKELSTSIKEHGVIQPIIVRKIGEKYEIIAGERRYKASALAGLTKIPAIIRNLDDKEASKVALLENLQRKDLTAIEEARTYQKILELDSMTQEELGRTMGKSQAAIANKLRLLALTDEVQEALLNDQISERHARSLLNVTNANEQVEMLERVINNRMTVRELDQAIRSLKLNHNEQQTLSTEEEKTVIEQPKENPTLTLEDLLKPQKESEVKPEVKEEIPLEFTQSTSDAEKPVTESRFISDFQELEKKPIIIETDEPVIAKVETVPEVKDDFFKEFKLKDAINLVRNVVPELKQKGLVAEVQEKDLGGKYQIIINIDK